MGLVPNYLQLAYTIWSEPSSIFLLFSAISYKGSGETVRMCRLACCFAARICDKYLNHMIWPMKFGLSLHLHPFFLVWLLLLLGSLTQTFCILVAHENSTFQYLKSTVSVPCVFGKQVLYWILNFHRTMNWCMFVMLLKVASFFCVDYFFTFVHVKKPRSSRQFFSRSQADRKSNIIWQDCANVHARLVFLCLNIP